MFLYLSVLHGTFTYYNRGFGFCVLFWLYFCQFKIFFCLVFLTFDNLRRSIFYRTIVVLGTSAPAFHIFPVGDSHALPTFRQPAAESQQYVYAFKLFSLSNNLSSYDIKLHIPQVLDRNLRDAQRTSNLMTSSSTDFRRRMWKLMIQSTFSLYSFSKIPWISFVSFFCVRNTSITCFELEQAQLTWANMDISPSNSIKAGTFKRSMTSFPNAWDDTSGE